MKQQATLELPAELYERLNSMAEEQKVPVTVLLERLAATHKPIPTYSGGNGGAILGEAVAHEEIHVWDRPHDDTFSMYVGDYAD